MSRYRMLGPRIIALLLGVAWNVVGFQIGLSIKSLRSRAYYLRGYAIEVVDHYPPPSISLPLCDFLLCHDKSRFPSKTQAKKAILHGSIGIFVTEQKAAKIDHTKISASAIQNVAGLTGTTTRALIRPRSTGIWVDPGETVIVLTRAPDQHYPISVTKYVFPPNVTSLISIEYEDDQLALVRKPENMTTIGSEDRSDLQSCLGFILRPSSMESSYHPRPVHRLDRRTSGLVLVAKTQAQMRLLSNLFATRKVTKTYLALVLDDGVLAQYDAADEWRTIDHPIDRREALSEWRVKRSCPPYSLLEVRPHHGRTHQIRRHLAYCLGTPIVGDAKYDKGAREERTNGMYLCCHSLTFPYLLDTLSDAGFSRAGETRRVRSSGDTSTLSVTIPLPEKFASRLSSLCPSDALS